MDGMKILENIATGTQKHPYYAVIRYDTNDNRRVLYFDELEDAKDCYNRSAEMDFYPQVWLNVIRPNQKEVTLEYKEM